MKPIFKVLIVLLAASLVLIGCSQQAAPTQTSDNQAALIGTISALQTQIAAKPSAVPATPTVLAAATTAVPTPAPTATLEPTATPAVTEVAATATTIVPVTASGVDLGPSFRVGNVIDLNFLDGTYVNANMTFTKIWKVTNVGTATWPANTKIISVDDNPFNLTPTDIGQVVSNGQSVELHVNLKAPEAVNNYKALFMLETPDGKKFGIGPDFDQPFWALLYVR